MQNNWSVNTWSDEKDEKHFFISIFRKLFSPMPPNNTTESPLIRHIVNSVSSSHFTTGSKQPNVYKPDKYESARLKFGQFYKNSTGKSLKLSTKNHWGTFLVLL